MEAGAPAADTVRVDAPLQGPLQEIHIVFLARLQYSVVDEAQTADRNTCLEIAVVVLDVESATVCCHDSAAVPRATMLPVPLDVRPDIEQQHHRLCREAQTAGRNTRLEIAVVVLDVESVTVCCHNSAVVPRATALPVSLGARPDFVRDLCHDLCRHRLHHNWRNGTRCRRRRRIKGHATRHR
eukprot:scaffold94848_cov65-Phaeocystis_antarctica.AAC.3